MTDYRTLSQALEDSALAWGIDWQKLEKNFGVPASLKAHAIITQLDERFYSKLPNDAATWKTATEYLQSEYPALTTEAAKILVNSISYSYK